MTTHFVHVEIKNRSDGSTRLISSTPSLTTGVVCWRGYKVGVVPLCCCHDSKKHEGAKFKECTCVSVNQVVAFERLVKMANLSEEELQALYAWIDEIPLSRQKKNINRDFSDGVLAAEVVHHFLPKLVELHNYSPANSTQQKMDNWRTVNSQYPKNLIGQWSLILFISLFREGVFKTELQHS